MRLITIRRHRAENVYTADFSRHPDAGSIRAAFGTTILPTPFGASISPIVVMDAIAAKNPDAIVIFDCEPERPTPRASLAGWTTFDTSTPDPRD